MQPVSLRPNQRFIWHGPSLFVTDPSGACEGTDPMAGWFFRETRFLSRLVLEINGVRPWPCAVGQPAQRELLIGFVYPELAAGDAGGSGTGGDRTPVDGANVPWRGHRPDATLSPAIFTNWWRS